MVRNSVRASLGLMVGAGLFGGVTIAGCSANGSDDVGYVPDIVVADGATEPTPGSSSSSSGNMSSSGDPDKPRKDAGPDASRDAAPDARDSGRDAMTPRDSGPDPRDSGGTVAPLSGTTCTVMGDVKQRACGFCGFQETVCDDDGAGGAKWSEYGPCTNEVADNDDRCMPGEISDNDCGLCGLSHDVCQRDCAWGRGACHEPSAACTPDSVRYITAGCSASSDYRKQTCSDKCSYGAASPLPCGPMESYVNITRTKNFSVTIDGVMRGEINKLTGTGTNPCTPAALTADGGPSAANIMPYTYIEIRNPHAKTAKVEVEFAPVTTTGSSFMYTFAAVYDGSMPMDNASRAACKKSNQYCSASSGSTYWSCFKGVDAFTIPANGKVFVYVQPTSKVVTPIKYTATVTTVSFDR